MSICENQYECGFEAAWYLVCDYLAEVGVEMVKRATLLCLENGAVGRSYGSLWYYPAKVGQVWLIC